MTYFLDILDYREFFLSFDPLLILAIETPQLPEFKFIFPTFATPHLPPEALLDP